jgi:ribonuclease VapC
LKKAAFLLEIERHECAVSAASVVECYLVMTAKIGASAIRLVDEYLDINTAEIVPFDRAQLEAAAEARTRYGKGTGHPAQLNFGDCFSYALAKTRNLPLLFKGDDFSHTDIVPAWRPTLSIG